jgi:hypothetical protein
MTKTIIQFNETSLAVKLSYIQSEFKANKSRFNSFGKYHFRSAEDILEALKPYNEKYQVYFTINETLVNANPPFMQSAATIFDCNSKDMITATAMVGVDLQQKGMQTPQAFGSASSYGKKYALGNLLLIDDTQDADATNTHSKEAKTEVIKPELVTGTDAYDKAVEYIAGGGDITLIEKKYKLTEQIKNSLLNK